MSYSMKQEQVGSMTSQHIDLMEIDDEVNPSNMDQVKVSKQERSNAAGKFKQMELNQITYTPLKQTIL